MTFTISGASFGNIEKMRSARKCLGTSRRSHRVASGGPSRATPTAGQRADLRRCSGYVASHLHSAVSEILPSQDSQLILCAKLFRG
jgi:hypothetical protein